MAKTSGLKALNYRLPVFKLCLVKESRATQRKKVVIKQPSDLARYLAPIAMAPEEHFIAVHLNAKSEVLGVHEVSHGTLSASLVHPREVFKAALVSNSHSIIVSHNHPSGASLSPSKEDFDTTAQLIEAGRILGVPVVDHVIVGPERIDSWYSFRENFPELWQGGSLFCD